MATGHASAPAERCRDYGRNMPAVPAHSAPGAGFAPVAALMGDPARAAMLTALLDDRALAAGELANLAGVSPATASEHLTRLRGGGLVTVVSPGRHGDRGPVPPRPARPGAQPAPVAAGCRASAGPYLLRPPGRPGRGGVAR